jgi:hypothetical protein
MTVCVFVYRKGTSTLTVHFQWSFCVEGLIITVLQELCYWLLELKNLHVATGRQRALTFRSIPTLFECLLKNPKYSKLQCKLQLYFLCLLCV